jgi:hypothetical protein
MVLTGQNSRGNLNRFNPELQNHVDESKKIHQSGKVDEFIQ